MKITKKTQEDSTEKLVLLKQIRSDQVFRRQGTTSEEAFSGKDEATFFMVIPTQPAKAGRVTVVSVDLKIVIELDDSHLVHPHPATIVVGEAELE